MDQLKANSVGHLDVTNLSFHASQFYVDNILFYWQISQNLSITPKMDKTQITQYLSLLTDEKVFMLIVVFQLFLDLLVNYLLGTK